MTTTSTPADAEPSDSPPPKAEGPGVRWTLSLLPTLIGAFGVVVLLIGAILSGVTDGEQGWAATLVAASLAAVAVISGWSYGLYLALFVVAIGGAAADGGPTTGELLALMITLLLAHEIFRFSFDARRPMRIGPGLIVRYVGWSTVMAVVLLGIGAVVEALVDRVPTDELWIPVGVVGASLPLFMLSGVERLQNKPGLDNPLIRAAIGALLTAAVVGVVVIGAQARGAIVPAEVESTNTAPTTTTTAPPTTEFVAAPTRTVDPWMVVVTVLVIAVMIYFILRKPEASFQLEEVEQPSESTSYDMAVAGLADSEAELISLDREALTRLLGDLQLDISGERDPGRAIRFGYAQIEQRLADLGVERAEAETEREFLTRAMTPLGSAAGSMATLTGLFERARFGHEPVNEDMRLQAIEAIDGLLAATAPATPSTSESSTAAERSNGSGDGGSI